VLPHHKLSHGYPEITKENIPYSVIHDTSKEKKILGINYKTKVETARDMMEVFAQKGW